MSATDARHDEPEVDDPDATVAYPPTRDAARVSAAAPADDADEATDETEARVLAVVNEYLEALDAGHHPDRRELLARHPDIAPRLSACLDSIAFVHVAGAQVQAATGLPAHDRASLSNPANSPRATSAAGDVSPSRELGDFKLIREIARGGMGVVYEAVQLSLGRRVAVKVLPFAATLDARHLQRFQNEARAAAQLHHTNIVPVYAVGCERSVHFYAMQMIEGQSLADVIKDLRAATENGAPKSLSLGSNTPGQGAGSASAHSAAPDPLSRSSDASPAHSLSLQRTTKRTTFYRTVAKLGLQAAEALDYAHDQGVVHRDVKPGNLLLDAKGNLWVTDFGLAHVYADSGLTQSGDLLGTLRYMSPEQASGRGVVLDQRTDVYSLGLTLYELLTLERALPGESREQLLRQIGVVEPRAPRSIDRAIPPELETILLTAAAKEPSDRYPSARAMADDLRRFLADEPIRARPPSLWDKGIKWTRRHRTLTIAALVMLALSAVGSSIGAVLIAKEQGRTQAAYLAERDRATEANQQRARAERSFAQAREAVDYLAHVAAEEMDRPEYASVRKPMLEASLAYYQSFLADRKDDPSLAAQLDADRSKVSMILAELGAFDTFFRSQYRLRLLGDRAVREDLKLSPEQVAAVRELGSGDGSPGASAAVRPGPQTRPRTPGQDLEKFSALSADLEAKIGRILTPPQVLRLRQIYWQVRGVGSFGEPEVVEALALSADQKARIRVVHAEVRNRRGVWGGPGGGGNAQDNGVAKVLASLTPEQVDAWTMLVGPVITDVFKDRRMGWPPNRNDGPGGGHGPNPPGGRPDGASGDDAAAPGGENIR